LEGVEAGSSNYPLRGGKYSEFDGGIRATAFVSGGFLPETVQGTKQDGLMHIADWYATFCGLAGVSVEDVPAAESGLPPVDGLDLWPLLSGANSTSPRIEIPVSNYTYINGDYKLVIGVDAIVAGYQGPTYPNTTTPFNNPASVNLDCTTGCLFNLIEDPNETNNIAAENPSLVQSMHERLQYWITTYYSNNEQGVNSCPPNITENCSCWMAENRYHGFYGPFQEL
jgi:arylsulfatase A-like enzyme